MAICRFVNTPGGCRYGTACKFTHSAVSPASSSRPGQSSNTKTAGPSSPFNRGASHAGTPPGVCSFYWTTANCKREFNCRYRHEPNPNSNNQASNTGLPIANRAHSAMESIAPFLTDQGLAKLGATGTDGFFPCPPKAMSPPEAHNALTKYLRDDYRFMKTFDVYGFVNPLSNATTSNKNWTSEDGQLFLTTIANGNGLPLVTRIICWSPVSTRAGSHPETLSFQRGLLPLLRFFSSDLVVKSTLSHIVKYLYFLMTAKQPLKSFSSGLYMCILNNSDVFFKQIQDCMEEFMLARSFKDPKVSSTDTIIGSQVLGSLAGVLFECLTRFKNSCAIYPVLNTTVRKLDAWLDLWIAGISASPPDFDDPFKQAIDTARAHITSYLKSKVERLMRIVDREQAKIERVTARTKSISHVPVATHLDESTLSALRILYDGPAEHSSLGVPRHDNDFVYIEDIRIAPTHKELICITDPFLPANLHGAPHPLPDETMQRLVDIQFRLLREELIAPLRTSVQLVRKDFLALTKNAKAKNQVNDLLKAHGGRYRGHIDAQESVMFNVYTGVEFLSLVPDRRGLSVRFSFDAPAGRARSTQSRARRAFWEGMSGKRMMQGGLIALVWKQGIQVDVHLGIVASSTKELTDSAQDSKDRVSARVVFFDSEIEIRILNVIKNRHLHNDKTVILVESPVMFEAIRPFLDTLQLVEPETIPFGQYLVHRPFGHFSTSVVLPPLYARAPGFAYQLAPLFSPEAGIDDLKLYVNDPESIAHARHELRRSRLDASQAEAVVDALTREIALIQGPPGTGKSFTGIELLRVLVRSATPILLIAFTNHALDHLLTGVLDAAITSKIVRLGSRSADERIKHFSLEELEQIAGRSRLDRSFAHTYKDLKEVEKEILDLMKTFTDSSVSSKDVISYLETQYPEHFEHILSPPSWISTLHSLNIADTNSGWQKVGRQADADKGDDSVYSFWVQGLDLEFLSNKVDEPQHELTGTVASQSGAAQWSNIFTVLQSFEQLDSDDSDDDDESDEELEPWQVSWEASSTKRSPDTEPFNDPVSASVQPIDSSRHPTSPENLRISDIQDPAAFFLANHCTSIPIIPQGDRALDMLLREGDLWSFSRVERTKLHVYWKQQVHEGIYCDRIEDFKRLRRKYAEANQVYQEGKNETRRQLLKNVDLIGCTTTGAAKLASLLKGLGPRIMVVEEAGQVLEAHILGSLVPSIEHMILIGDPLQLRPTLNNYRLSVDSMTGKKLYRFDMSLMERLSSSQFPMSQINVQRRMRPSISNLIRKTLYPNLIDNDVVTRYSDVRGIAKNVYFLTHNHQENGGVEESSSKYNDYEPLGCNDQGPGAAPTALARIRDALIDLVAVVIDERDQVELNDREGDQADEIPDTHVEHIKVSKRVRLRTIDNYQGEEAKIIILSLVRNAGNTADGQLKQKSTIGFLRSDNRTNGNPTPPINEAAAYIDTRAVALSRAKEGLFILGNAHQLATRSSMWRGVVDELRREDSLSEGIPIACYRHPEEINYVSEPGQLQNIAPDGQTTFPASLTLLGSWH
ncbi:hypothetical protein H0H93_005815 [Arthromyces matolae]|nr:hypothetical protein H0H93_005815 [Arthromyces matolae]